MPHALFEPFNLGMLHLANRVVMAPLTRCRAGTGDVPTSLMAEYYAQRASAGLIITEGAPVSLQARGYVWTPGIYTSEQIAGWRDVANAVHAKNGLLFMQLWHTGRISHTSLQPLGAAPKGPSDIVAADSNCFAYNEHGQAGYMQASVPVPLNATEIADTIEHFAQAATNARTAGLDGVEIHGANGYLFDQFLNSQVNTRTDAYGGSLEKRAAFLLAVVDAVIARIGADRVGVRISPYGQKNAIPITPDTEPTFLYLAEQLNRRNVVYLHINDQGNADAPAIPAQFLSQLRTVFRGSMLLCGGYDVHKAKQMIDDGLADLIVFGRPFISNPDLPARLQHGWPLNPFEVSTFYGGDAAGYTDYQPYTPT